MLSIKNSSAVVRGAAARDEDVRIMRIKMLRNTRSGSKPLTMGKEYSAPGDLPMKDAIFICGIGKAVEVKAKKPAKPVIKKPVIKKPVL